MATDYPTDYPASITFDNDAFVTVANVVTNANAINITNGSYTTINTNGPIYTSGLVSSSSAWTTTATLPLTFTTTFTPSTLSYDEMINLVPTHPFQAGDDGACWHCHSQGAHRNDMMSHVPITIEEEPTLEEWCDLLVA